MELTPLCLLALNEHERGEVAVSLLQPDMPELSLLPILSIAAPSSHLSWGSVIPAAQLHRWGACGLALAAPAPGLQLSPLLSRAQKEATHSP